MKADDDQALQDRRVAALLGDGVSFRQVAALLGLSLGAVQRTARRARSSRILSLPDGSAAGDAARRLFYHGRGSEAFSAWMRTGQVGMR